MTYISVSNFSPRYESNYASYSAPGFNKVNESMVGAGFTYYGQKSPTFISASFGPGKFTFKDSYSHEQIKTKNGFSMQLKTGLAWWISRQVGFAFSVMYVRTSSTNKEIEKLNSNRFGLMLNLTLN